MCGTTTKCSTPNKMTDRKFYKTEYRVTVLTENPLHSTDLGELHYMTTEGDASGHVEIAQVHVLNGKEAADALCTQASDPSFFRLDDEGEDAE